MSKFLKSLKSRTPVFVLAGSCSVVLVVLAIASILMFTGACNEAIVEKQDKTFVIIKGTNIDLVAGIGFVGVALAFVWSSLFSIINNLDWKFVKVLRYIAVIISTGVPLILYASQMPLLDKARQDADKHFDPDNRQTVCNHSKKGLEAQQKVVRIEAITKGCLSFAIGMIVFLVVFEPLFLLSSAGVGLPTGVHLVIGGLVSVALLGCVVRYWVLNRQCLRKVLPLDVRKNVQWTKLSPFAILSEFPCNISDSNMNIKCNQKSRLRQIVKSACTSDILLLGLGITLAAAFIICLVWVVLGSILFAPATWTPKIF